MKVLKSLQKNKHLWVIGDPGMGKSAVVKEVAHLVYDRDIYSDGVLYISLKECTNFQSLVDKLFLTILHALVDSESKQTLEKFINSSTVEKYHG